MKRPWKRRIALAAVLAVSLFLGGRAVLDPVATEPGPGPDPSIDLSDTVTLTLEIEGTVPEGPVRIWATVGDATLLEARGRLPFPLAVPRGQTVAVLVEAPGRGRFYRRVVRDEDGELAIGLPPGETLAGVVVDERGEPVPNARVEAMREDVAQPAWLATADAEGRFEIDTLLTGSHRVQAGAEGYGTAVRAGIEPGELRLVIERAGIVAGRVLDPEGLPAEGAEVQIAGSGLWPARVTTSGDGGRFVLSGVPPGIYEVRARREGLVADPRRGIEVDPASRVFLTFHLEEGARLTGIISDADTGEPVDGASIIAAAEALDVAPRAAVSGEDGRFVIAGLRGVPHRVSVTAPGYVPATAVEWSPGSPLEIALVPGGTLIGVVLDEDRQPIAGAHLEVLGDSDGQPVALDERQGFASAVFQSQLSPLPFGGGSLPVTTGPVPPIPIDGPVGELGDTLAPLAPLPRVEGEQRMGFVTDEEGRFRIDGVPPGHVQIVARADGFASTATDRLFVSAGQTVDELELILPPAGELHGRVLDHRGDGLEGVLVEVRSDREPHPRVAFTDQTGAFSLAAVVGELAVTAMPNGQPAARARAEVTPGGRADVTLQLEGELHTLRGRTVDARGFPVSAVQVSLVSLRSDAPHRRTVWSEADGTFQITGLPAPPWRLEASEVGHAPARLDVFGADEEVQLPLERAAHVSGQLLDDYTGEPVLAAVELVRDVLPAERMTARTDAEGRFRFRRVRAGEWTLSVRSDAHLAADVAVTLEDDRRGPNDLALEPTRLTPAGRIEGTVVDALGHTVARARVWVGELSTRSDSDGTYVLRGLAEGSVTPSASHPACGEVEAAPVRILEGRETLGVVLHLPERFDPERAATLEGRRRGVALELRADGDAVLVARAIDGSRAARVGLREGDRLLVIDGEEVGDVRSATRALAGPVGVPAILRVQRDDFVTDLLVDREVWLRD